ncbi:fimbrial protein [Pseudocitrobacter faecalis]|uniref:fimbrial protein n=1 Tax=Pseudocitrobacter faecalis TaxID=1398493 RepID=UPI0039EF1B85
MFKKSLVAASIMVLSCGVFAATDEGVAGGTITFNGTVTDTTCNVTTNNGADFTVNLSPITTTDLGTSVGVVTAGAKEFTMAVSGCTGYAADTDSLKVNFTSSNVSDDEKYLTNYSGTAEGVGIALTKDGSTQVNFNEALETGLTAADVSGSTGTSNITYYANYYNYGGAATSTGSVVTAATYTFSYE